MIRHPKFNRITQRIGVWRFSGIELLGMLIVFIFAMPFVEDFSLGRSIEPILLTLLLVSALLAVGGRRRVLITGLCLLIPAIIFRWSHHLLPERMSPVFFIGFGLTFIGFVIVNILHYIMRASRVNTEVICAGISAYLLIAIMWAMAYKLLGDIDPRSFYFANVPNAEQTMTNANSFYFSFATISSVGYGDITPVTRVARMLAVMEAITGLFFMAVLISRLVSLYSPKVSEPEQKS
jgi:voltage-gated potassium channel